MPSKPYTGLLQYGSTGQAVKDVQAALGLKQTGTYDHATEAAVKSFQAKSKIEQNGLVGAMTWEALFPGPPKALILPARYFTQRDSEVVARGQAQASRSCFSSSCAMFLEHLKPGTLPGANGDDTYLRKVLTYGDTTDSRAQVLALASYGISAQLKTNAGFEDIRAQIRRSKHVPLGFLHHGPLSAPTGGGHWIDAYGYDETGLWVMDPWGEINLQTGQYISTNGAKLHYSYAGLGPRWSPDGHSGWMMYAP